MNMTVVSNGGEWSDARLFFVDSGPERILRAIEELNTLAALPGWDGDGPEWWRLKEYRVVGTVTGIIQTEKVWGVSRLSFESFLRNELCFAAGLYFPDAFSDGVLSRLRAATASFDDMVVPVGKEGA